MRAGVGSNIKLTIRRRRGAQILADGNTQHAGPYGLRRALSDMFNNIIYSDEYKVIPGFVAELRQRAGLSQCDLATALDRSQSHVHRLETGQRPVDIIEFLRLMKIAGAEPEAAFADLLARLTDEGCDFAPESVSTPLERKAS